MQAATGAATGALPLASIEDASRVRIVVYLAQEEARLARVGDSVDLSPDGRGGGTTTIQARITRLTGAIDSRTRTMPAEIEVENGSGVFCPGEFVRARLSLRAPVAVSVPVESLFVREGKTTVAVVQDGHAVFMPVQVEQHDGTTVRVSGLTEGAMVALHVGDDVSAGAPVRAVSK